VIEITGELGELCDEQLTMLSSLLRVSICLRFRQVIYFSYVIASNDCYITGISVNRSGTRSHGRVARGMRDQVLNFVNILKQIKSRGVHYALYILKHQ
jgi:hypothetical protein